MDFSDRLTWLLLGCLIGYGFRLLQEIRNGLVQVNKTLKESRNEKGSITVQHLRDVALFLVVGIVFYGSVMAQVAANRSNDASDKSNETSEKVIALQQETKQNLDCTTQIVFDTIRALNERTTFTGDQVIANIKLVKGQLKLLLAIREPDVTDAEAIALFNRYVARVAEFVELSEKTLQQQSQYAYPTVKDLTDCLAQPADEPEKG